ncbi:hypothetical protein BDZ94DRAFT_1310459 [Collybia nuda]|uniref:Uncharacterized protein n=1 Tax=Collybia nuda TaxID=64659 RepID=A0A9P6CI55_9AGAR|nr:hypothetical protein BDZ94DRAFT_1310459 [Collybia nuda]
MLERGLFEENGVEFSLEDDDYTADEWNTYNGRQVLAWFQERPSDAHIGPPPLHSERTPTDSSETES